MIDPADSPSTNGLTDEPPASTQRESDPVVEHLKALGLPLTFQNYVNKRFGDQTWDAELAATFPEQFKEEAFQKASDSAEPSTDEEPSALSATGATGAI